MNRLDGRADALKRYVGWLPEKPMPPFHYQLVFSVEGLINEYVEPARILRKGKLITIDPLTEPEEFHMNGFAPLVAFHTSGRHIHASGNLRRTGRRLFREDPPLSRTLRPVV